MNLSGESPLTKQAQQVPRGQPLGSLDGFALAAIGALAVALRLLGNGFGLPDAVMPDEPKIVNHALAFGLGDPNPHYFVYPALQMYVLFVAYGLLFVMWWLMGVVPSVEGFKLLFLSDPTLFYRVGRSVTALFALGSVLLVFALARRLYGSPRAGLLAALALACHPIDARHGRYVTADVPMTFFLLLGLLLLAVALDTRRPWSFVLAGTAGGLATATKYSGLIFALPLVTCAVLAARRAGRSLLPVAIGAGVAGMAVAFCLTSPFSVIEWRETLDGMQFILDVKRDGQFGVARGASWATYVQAAFLGAPLAIFSLLGCAWSCWRRRTGDVLVLSLAVPYFLTVSSSQSHSARYLVPLFPLLMILAARFAVEAATVGRAMRSATVPVRFSLAELAFLAAVVFGLGQTAVEARELFLPDTRRLAREWIEREVPPGTTIALEWGGDDTVRLAECQESLAQKIRAYQQGRRGNPHQPADQMLSALRLMEAAQTGRPRFRLVTFGAVKDNRLDPREHDLDGLRATGVSYVVTSSEALTDGRSAAFARTYPRAAGFYARLDREAQLAARFEARRGRLRGPAIAVYRLSTNGAVADGAAFGAARP